jgi:hypothetical protein
MPHHVHYSVHFILLQERAGSLVYILYDTPFEYRDAEIRHFGLSNSCFPKLSYVDFIRTKKFLLYINIVTKSLELVALNNSHCITEFCIVDGVKNVLSPWVVQWFLLLYKELK